MWQGNRLAAAVLVSFVTLLCGGAGRPSIGMKEFPWKNGDSAGAVYKMSDHPNGVFVFEVFSLSCSWCNANAEQVDLFAEEYRENARVQVLDLGLDADNNSYQRWIGSHRPNHPVVQDVNRAVWNKLKRQDGIPQTFVVDCRGELVGSTIGYWGDAEKQSLRRMVTTALATSCAF